MKKIYILFLLSAHTIFAQDYSVEKSTFSFQTGLVGFWLNNESRLSDKFTLRTEIGLDVFTQKDNEKSADFDALVPVLLLNHVGIIILKKEELPERTYIIMEQTS